MTVIDGIINLNKPTGLTSAKALYKVRSLCGIRKSGHAGTLDPGADGVLVLCMGKATKLVESIMDHPKVYRAGARLDVTSESYDSDRPHIPVNVPATPDRQQVLDSLKSFEGTFEQVPPAISAIKIGGVPSYKLVRHNQTPTLKARPVTVYWTHLINYDWPNIEFEMACGRGTYVRSLIRDLGERLATGGCLTSLTRKAVGPFQLQSAWALEMLAQHDPHDYIIALEEIREILNRRPIAIPERYT